VAAVAGVPLSATAVLGGGVLGGVVAPAADVPLVVGVLEVAGVAAPSLLPEFAPQAASATVRNVSAARRAMWMRGDAHMGRH
jgi:hypothetical protein